MGKNYSLFKKWINKVFLFIIPLILALLPILTPIKLSAQTSNVTEPIPLSPPGYTQTGSIPTPAYFIKSNSNGKIKLEWSLIRKSTTSFTETFDEFILYRFVEGAPDKTRYFYYKNIKYSTNKEDYFPFKITGKSDSSWVSTQNAGGSGGISTKFSYDEFTITDHTVSYPTDSSSPIVSYTLWAAKDNNKVSAGRATALGDDFKPNTDINDGASGILPGPPFSKGQDCINSHQQMTQHILLIRGTFIVWKNFMYPMLYLLDPDGGGLIQKSDYKSEWWNMGSIGEALYNWLAENQNATNLIWFNEMAEQSKTRRATMAKELNDFKQELVNAGIPSNIGDENTRTSDILQNVTDECLKEYAHIFDIYLTRLKVTTNALDNILSQGATAAQPSDTCGISGLFGGIMCTALEFLARVAANAGTWAIQFLLQAVGIQ